MNWDDVGDAIHAAITRASGLPAAKVIWKDQDRASPAPDYVTLRLGTMLPVGVDSIGKTYDPTRIRGEEIKLETQGTRETTIEVEAFTTSSVSGRNASALALVSRIYSGLLLPSTREILNAQDVSVFDVLSISWIPDVPSTHFRGRAIGTLRCYMPAPTVSEYTGYIERITGEVRAKGGVEDLVRAFDTAAEAGGEED